jgi:hypothetical protein
MSTTYVVTNEGLQSDSDARYFIATAEGTIRLSTDTFSDLTTVNFASIHEPTFPGYSPKPVTNGQFGDGTATVGRTTIGSVTFTCTQDTSRETISYVWLQTFDNQRGVSVCGAIAALPGGPQVITSEGDSILDQLTLTNQRPS